MSSKTVELIYQPKVPEAIRLAEECARAVESAGFEPRLVDIWKMTPPGDRQGIHMAVTFGGDGTIIRASRWLAGTNAPILGVAMGKLGFLTELAPEDACAKLPSILNGGYWRDERLMICATVEPLPGEHGESNGAGPFVSGGPMLALNDVVIARGANLRVVHFDVWVDGAPLAQYVADGLILATPTGSTAYALSAGGPVLAPGVQGLLMIPLAAHLAQLRSLVVPTTARIEVHATSEQTPILVLDGQLQLPLGSDRRVAIELAPQRTIFARTGSPTSFYETLMQSFNKKR